MAFDENVFINCPFDDEYLPLLRPLLFTVIYLGLTPQIASERVDSGVPRVTKIIELIKGSKFGIHDLSRLMAERVGEYYRLNMPFELGVDVGCRLFQRGRCASKRCLVLEKERYRYHAAISDMAGSDIAAHNNEPEQVVAILRHWLNKEARLRAPGPTKIWADFNSFMAANYDALTASGYSPRDIEELPIGELIDHIKAWVTANRR